MNRLIESEQNLSDWIKENLSFLQQHKIILLSGDLGAGKTTFVKLLAKQLGIKVPVQSPTYNLHHMYESDGIVMHHFDLYRLQDESDLETTDFWAVAEDTKAYVCVEWPERLGSSYAFKNPHCHLSLKLSLKPGMRELLCLHPKKNI